MTPKETILVALRAFVAQRPGLEFGNYGDVAVYRSEMRSITRDCTEARRLLGYVDRSGITAEQIADASKRAFSGRLDISPSGTGGWRVGYCTGQYWPTEYRKAVCAVLASAIWDYWRDASSTGDSLRRNARNEFGRGIASRWFH
jgi:hypothetical protein